MKAKRFSISIEGTEDAALAVDTEGRIAAWNKAAGELFGLSKAEAIGAPCHEILQCSDENSMACSNGCIIERAVHDNQPIANFDLRVQTKNGKLWCNLSTLIAHDSATEARQVIYIVRPCEVRKRLEQALSEFVRTQTKNGANDKTTAQSAIRPTVAVRLTAREIEVLKSLAKGHSTRTIANQLNISAATVSNHVKHILTKFDAHSRLEAIRHAESAGVI